MADKATMEVLRHWADNVDRADEGHLLNITDEYCAYCSSFSDKHAEICGECPVKIDTGYDACKNTPWLEVAESCSGFGIGIYKARSTTRDACWLEFQYLLNVAISQDLISLDEIDEI